MNRKEHWESVYTSKAPAEMSWYQLEPALSLEMIGSAGLGPDAELIDAGGGSSVLVDRLIDQGYRHITVLDISGRALKHARQRLGARAAQAVWIEADVTGFSPAHPYDLWHDRAVFHFLTDARDRSRYVEVLERAVRRGGSVIIAAFAIGGPTQCSGLEIVQYDAARLAAALGSNFRLLEQRQELHVTPAQRHQLFGYFRFERL